jgi:hypothetical protein
MALDQATSDKIHNAVTEAKSDGHFAQHMLELRKELQNDPHYKQNRVAEMKLLNKELEDQKLLPGLHIGGSEHVVNIGDHGTILTRDGNKLEWHNASGRSGIIGGHERSSAHARADNESARGKHSTHSSHPGEQSQHSQREHQKPASEGPGEHSPTERPGEKTPPGDEKKPITDPGHVTHDANGNTITRWDNGVVQVVNDAAQTGYVKVPDGKGGYHEHHWGPKASDNVDTDRKIENQGADAAFQKRIGDAYSQLPDGVRAKIDKAGIEVVATDRMSTVHPELKNAQPRGYPPGYDSDSVEGEFDGKKIIIPENPIVQEKNKADPVGTIRHEAGHAFDQSLNHYSHSAEFDEAYKQDLAKLTPEQKKQLGYYLQGDNAGKEELFGELFCAAVGGHPDKDHYPEDVRKLFPNSYKLVEKQINDAH